MRNASPTSDRDTDGDSPASDQRREATLVWGLRARPLVRLLALPGPRGMILKRLSKRGIELSPAALRWLLTTGYDAILRNAPVSSSDAAGDATDEQVGLQILDILRAASPPPPPDLMAVIQAEIAKTFPPSGSDSPPDDEARPDVTLCLTARMRERYQVVALGGVLGLIFAVGVVAVLVALPAVHAQISVVVAAVAALALFALMEGSLAWYAIRTLRRGRLHLSRTGIGVTDAWGSIACDWPNVCGIRRVAYPRQEWWVLELEAPATAITGSRQYVPEWLISGSLISLRLFEEGEELAVLLRAYAPHLFPKT